MLLLLFATCSLSLNYYFSDSSDLKWHPNMDLANSVTFRNNNMVDSIKLGAKLKVDKLPKAQCITEGNQAAWGYESKEKYEENIKYETYLELKAADICGSGGAGGQQSPIMGGGQGAALGTPCIQAKKEKDLLAKMSQAVAEVFKPYEPLIQLCKNKIYKDNKTEACEPKVQAIDVLKNSCELFYEDVKADDKLDLYIKSGNLELKESNTYESFDNEVKTVAQAAFLKAGGVCLSPIKDKERVDWNSCKIVSNLEADQLLKETGASIVIFIATLVWGLLLAALIWAGLYACKAWQKRRQGEPHLDA